MAPEETMMFNSMKRFVAAMAVTTIAAVALSGCVGQASEGGTAEASSDGTLTIGTLVAPTTFAASNATWANEAPYVQAVYDTLLRADPDGTVQPWLATEWSYNDDNTVLTMTLRDDVEFTDGTAFDAEAAASNLMRFRDGTSPQKAYLGTLADAKALDETTLELTLSAPNPALLSFLTQAPGLQQSPASFGAADEQTNPVGSGPYILDEQSTVVGSTYVFTKNPDYWAPDEQHYAEVVMNVYSTPTAVINAVKGGQINGATLTDNSLIPQAEASGFTANGHQLDFFGMLLFDRDGAIAPELADVRVRQAINYSFDREALLEAIGQGYGEITSSVFSPNGDGFSEAADSYYSYDPEKAKDLLAEAGYAAGDITLVMPVFPGFPPASYALAKQYLGDIGINVEEVSVAPSSFITDLLAPKFATTVMQLKAAPTPWETLTLDLLPQAGWNPFHTEDATVAELATTVQSGTEEDAAAAAKQLNEYIVEQAWFAPWYRPQQTYVTDAETSVRMQVGNAYPYLWNFVPKQ